LGVIHNLPLIILLRNIDARLLITGYALCKEVVWIAVSLLGVGYLYPG
jgi:hypothetical protein